MPENTVSALGEDNWKPFAALEDDDRIWTSATEVSIEGLEPFLMMTAVPADSAKSIANTTHQSINGHINGQNGKNGHAPKPGQPSTAAPQPSYAAAPPSAPPLSFHPSPGAQQPAPVVDVHPAEFTPLMPRGAAGTGGKIDLIADIPVRVTVELGKTRKNISEILGIAPGSVIELDKMAGEPVDVLVNGKLIAKGEVVVIDENFGVRITEVLNTTKAHA